MMADLHGERVRTAVEAIGVPPYPAARIAERIAEARAERVDARRMPRLTRLLVAGAVFAGAVAVAVPSARHMPDAVQRTMERLLHHRSGPVRTYEYEYQPIALEEARRHTTFPVVVPEGFQISDARPWGKNEGITLTIKDPKLGVVMLAERYAGTPLLALEGYGIHDDGSYRRFNVRRWTIGRVAFSIPMFDPHYHDIAVRIERATRVAAARNRR